MDPPSSPPNNFRRTWGEDRTKDRYKDWPWHSSSSLHLCYMRDWHLESAFVYSSLWLNAKYIGVSAQSSQPNTDGNLFNLESESGRNEQKNNAKDRTSRTLVTLVSVRVCVCGSILCWIYFDIWIFTATEKEFEQSSMWSMWSKWIDPQGAEIPLLPGSRRRHKRRSGAMMVAEAFFNFPYIWWKGLLYTGVYQKTVETRYKHFRRKSQDLLTHPYHLFVENLDAAQKLLGPMPSAMVAIVFQSPSVL